MNISLSSININYNRRPINESKVSELADSIKHIGLINPITVRREGSEGYTLIAGLHRLQAFKILNEKAIEANILNVDHNEAELMEIDENLIRNEIHFIDRGDYFNRRDEILISLGLRAKQGDNRYTISRATDSVGLKTTNEIANELGICSTKLREEKQISKSLIPEAKEIVKIKELPKEEAKRIAKEEPEIQKRIILKIANGEAKNHKEASLMIKREEVIERIEGNPKSKSESIDLHNTSSRYRVIYADPPWSYGNSMPDYFTEQRDHYRLMTLEEICKLPIKDIAQDNAVLFLWVTSPILEESFQVIKSWGFKYKSSFVWDKIKHNMGHYNSVRHEMLLIATKGSCMPDIPKLYDSVQSIERTGHSEKPEEFINIIDTIYPLGNRLELFARNKVEGWDVYGNEI